MLFPKLFLKSLRFLLKQRSTIIRKFNDVSFEDISEVSPTLIKRSLTANKINFEEGYTSFIINCPTCNKSTKSSSKIYINKVTGSFSCPSCMSSGQWVSLDAYLKKGKKKEVKAALNVISEFEKVTAYLQDVEKNTVLLKTIPEESLVKILSTFGLPVISPVAIENVPIRVDPTFNKLYFPLNNVELRTVGYKVLDLDEHEPRIEPSLTCVGVLSGKSTKSKETAILVPNISDFLVLLNCKMPSYIVCLPNGLMNLPQHILPSLERFNKLILWFGSDLNSWDSARNFAKKLGEKRCLFVRPTDKQPLPHAAAEEDLKSIVNAAQTIWHKSITTFASLREDVLAELQNIDKVHGIKWKRYPTLNRILKGHRRGELTILTGPTGCGKTTFISEYSLDLAIQGVNTLWGSFEIRNVRLAKTMLQQMAGLALDKHLDVFDSFADKFEKLPMYYMTFHGQQSVKVVMEAVEHAQYVHDIAHVVIDNVQFMMGVSEDSKHMDRFWKQDVIIAAFRTFATRKNCHVTLVIHPRKERDAEDLTTSSIFGGAKASQEADNILIIQDKSLTSMKGKKYLQIAKNRYTGDLGVMALDFDKNSLSFAQKKKKSAEEKTTKVVVEPVEPNPSNTVDIQ